MTICIDCGDMCKTRKATRCKTCSGRRNRRLRSTKSLEQRFWDKVHIPHDPDSCWEWSGAIDPVTGYGRIGLGSRNNGVGNAHRISYELAYEFVSAGMLVCHTCDNRRCVNPYHLYEGTYTDNLNDRYARTISTKP